MKIVMGRSEGMPAGGAIGDLSQEFALRDGARTPTSDTGCLLDTSSTFRSPSMNCSMLIADRASVSIPEMT